jgi:hypothetical protein
MTTYPGLMLRLKTSLGQALHLNICFLKGVLDIVADIAIGVVVGGVTILVMFALNLIGS